MVQQTIFEYQPVSPLFISSSSLGVKDFTHSPHEIFLRGSQIFDQSVKGRIFPLSLLPIYHLESGVFDWTS